MVGGEATWVIQLFTTLARRETLPLYRNTPTVVVVLVPLRGGLLMIRRALPGEGQGRLALPGGFQMLGQTWQEAGAREVLEETGVPIEAASLQVVAVETTPDRRQNLLFCQSPPVTHEGAFRHDAEVSEVLVIHETRGVSEISCLGRAVDPVQAMARVKRSPKRMAN